MPKVICRYRGDSCDKQDGTLCRSENPNWCLYSTPKSEATERRPLVSTEFNCSVTKTLNDTQMIDIIIRSYQRMGRTVTETAWQKDDRGFSRLVLVFGDE